MQHVNIKNLQTLRRFYTYVEGSSVQYLKVSVLPGNGGQEQVKATVMADQTQKWTRQSVLVDPSGVTTDYQVTVKGLVQGENFGVIAIDDVSFSEGKQLY